MEDKSFGQGEQTVEQTFIHLYSKCKHYFFKS